MGVGCLFAISSSVPVRSVRMGERWRKSRGLLLGWPVMYMKDSKRRLTLVKESGAQNRNESAWNMWECVVWPEEERGRHRVRVEDCYFIHEWRTVRESRQWFCCRRVNEEVDEWSNGSTNGRMNWWMGTIEGKNTLVNIGWWTDRCAERYSLPKNYRH